MNNVFNSIIKNSGSITVGDFLTCIGVALVTGFIIALAYMIKNDYSKGFVATLVMLPPIVTAVIMMVSGNLGAGVAVAGAFSLVRFRSAQGTAKEIAVIFLAMSTGLAFGVGYVAFGLMLGVILSVVGLVLNLLGFGDVKDNKLKKNLKITIPEELDYTEVFDDLMEEYTTSSELVAVKSTNMGSMFKLNYEIKLKDASKEKEFVDKLRCRNGNLEILVSKVMQTESYL